MEEQKEFQPCPERQQETLSRESSIPRPTHKSPAPLISTPPPTPTSMSIPTSIKNFDDCPDEDPRNWPLSKKLYIICFTLLSVMNSGVSSSLPSNAVPYIYEDLKIDDQSQSSLPTSVFLLGYVVGPLIWSPLSETIGRRPVLVYTFIVFFLFTIACALAPNWPTLLFFRFVCGCMGASPQTVIGGVYADIFEARARGRVMAFYGAAASFGPILGPILSGFASQHGWRWSFWADLIFAGVAMSGLIFLPETFGPVLLKRRAAKLSKLSGTKVTASLSTIDTDLSAIFLRPLYMLVFEPIILATSIYVAIVYALVFFFFQAYPIIFPETYNFSIQQTSLTLIPLGIGACSTGIVALSWDLKYHSAIFKRKSWAFPYSPETHHLPISCISSILIVISLFWLAWTATPTVHWIVPTLSGLFFGFGYQIIFTSMMTYVTDAYKTYSASAIASSVILRSILGAALPVAAKPMYASLGVGWATSLVGFVSLLCVPIPFVLLWKGSWLREKSTFCQMWSKDEFASQNSSSDGVQGQQQREEC